MAFIEQVQRLFRDAWKNTGELAEEIACILSDWGKNGVQGPLKIQNTGNQTPLQVQQMTPELPATLIQFNFPDGSNTKFENDGSVVTTDPDGNETTASGGSGSSGTTGTSTGGLLGVIVSGSGSSYTVQLQGSGVTVAATHPQISEDETIPAGRYVGVYLVGTSYYILEPTWLEVEDE